MVVAGIGEALWDYLPEGRKLGGAPTNFAFHCAQLGMKSYAVYAVGKDELGDEILQVCKEGGLNVVAPQVPFPTGTVRVSLDDKGVPVYDICKDVAWDHIPYTQEMQALAKYTDAVCWGTLAQRSSESRTTIARFLADMPETAWRVFDINLRQNFYNLKIIVDSLEACNILKINGEELVLLCRLLPFLSDGVPAITNDYNDIDFQTKCRSIIARYRLEMLVLTCGEQGSYVFLPDGAISFQPTPIVTVVDTVGAGDSFTAAFVSALLSGKDVSEAHELAVRISAYVCTQQGAMPQIPEELRSACVSDTD